MGIGMFLEAWFVLIDTRESGGTLDLSSQLFVFQEFAKELVSCLHETRIDNMKTRY